MPRKADLDVAPNLPPPTLADAAPAPLPADPPRPAQPPLQLPQAADAPPPPPPSLPAAVAGPLEKKEKEVVTIEDLTLPKSIITRLAKSSLPPNTQIQASASLALSKSAVVFISYLSSHANLHTIEAGKKTISPADVFKALDDTELSFLRAPLEAEFARFHSIQTEKRSSYRQKARAAKDALPRDATAVPSITIPIPSCEAGPPLAKRPRTDGHDADETEDEEDAADGPAEDQDDPDEGDEEEEEEDDDDDDDERTVQDENGNADSQSQLDGAPGPPPAHTDVALQNGRHGSDDTVDALEEKAPVDDADEALDDDDDSD